MVFLLCDFLYITGCEMLGDWGKEWIELEVILFSQVFAEHLSLINRDCKIAFRRDAQQNQSCVSFSVSQMEKQNIDREDHSDAHVCSLSVNVTWLVRFSLT